MGINAGRWIACEHNPGDSQTYSKIPVVKVHRGQWEGGKMVLWPQQISTIMQDTATRSLPEVGLGIRLESE